MAFKFRLVAVLGLTLIVAGCASGYEQFYQANPPPPPGSIQLVDFVGEPRIIPSLGNLTEDTKHLYEDGYGQIGVSNFVGPVQNQAGAIAQAKKVGAAIVVVWNKYQSTANGAVPITTTTPQTTYNNGSMTAYGNNGGMVNGNYSGTSTTYVSQTTMMPYSVERYNQIAVYFKPLERKGFGAMFGPLSAEQHQKVGTNKGEVILAIRKESPAFTADILVGDIVLSINDQPIYDIQSSLAALMAARGGKANLLIFRNDKQIKKAVPIPADEW